VALVALFAVSPASAATVPYQKDWKRAARDGGFKSVPAPSRLYGFVPTDRIPGGDDRGVFGASGPSSDSCPRFPNKGVGGFFLRTRDSAEFLHGYTNKVRPARCNLSRGLAGKRIRRIRVLGAWLNLYRVASRVRGGSSYQVRGTLHGNDAFLTVNYTQPRSSRGIVRIAQGLRWVRR
jgi:hypothetical protein